MTKTIQRSSAHWGMECTLKGTKRDLNNNRQAGIFTKKKKCKSMKT